MLSFLLAYCKRSSLQSQATIISNNLLTISDHLADQKDLFASLVAYPGPEYPTRTQATALEQLLRTKLDPRVDDWVARGRAAGQKHVEGGPATAPAPAVGAAAGAGAGAGAAPGRSGVLGETDLAELWAWAPVEANREARQRNWGGNFTLEEREMGVQNVVTGLRRELEDDDDDEEDEDEEDEEEDEAAGDEMEIVGARTKSTGGGLEFDIAAARSVQDAAVAGGPVMPLDDVLRFMTAGVPPKQR